MEKKTKGAYTLNTLYNKNSVFGRLKLYFSQYFVGMTKPTANNLLNLILAIIVLETAVSVRFLYKHFISKVSDKSLNVFYHLCSYARLDIDSFAKVTVSIALKIIPDTLKSYPVFLCVDDTIISKFGKNFENVAVVYDHASKKVNKYLNGHNFVSIMLCFPVFENRQVYYKAIPIQYKMWHKDTNKLELASNMIRTIMPCLDEKIVITLCDSWYAKKNFLCIIDEYENLDVICNARIDTAMFNLPEIKKGRGRKPQKGSQIQIDDLNYSENKIGNYYVATKKVITRIFSNNRVVTAYLTKPELDSNSRRLFLSTINPEDIHMAFAWHTEDEAPINSVNDKTMKYVPLMLYQYRWNIEVSYYESKTFWSLGNYMVRSKNGIENLLNIINITKFVKYR